MAQHRGVIFPLQAPTGRVTTPEGSADAVIQARMTSAAMAAGVSDTLHDMAWIVSLIDAAAPTPKREPCKKRDISN